MKKITIGIAILALFASSTFAANFSPTVMKLTAPSSVLYQFDGSALSIPVTVSGTNGAGSIMPCFIPTPSSLPMDAGFCITR